MHRLTKAAVCSLLVLVPIEPRLNKAHCETRTLAQERARFEPTHQLTSRKLDSFALKVIESTRRELSTIFPALDQVQPTIIFVETSLFFATTRMPEWTNALFLRNQIFIPVKRDATFDPTDLTQAIRHEFVHAVVAFHGKNRCPGWLDEGLAQMFEGGKPADQANSLRRWLSNNDPIPLAQLQGGFTGLPREMVPAAYAQALAATKYLVRVYGLTAIVGYITRLGTFSEDAFAKTFGLTEGEFERALTLELKARYGDSRSPYQAATTSLSTQQERSQRRQLR